MIKNFNVDEVEILRNRLSELIILKNVISKNLIDDFKSEVLSLKKAVNVFFCLKNTNFKDSNIYINEIITCYLRKFNMLNDDNYEIMQKYTFDYSIDYTDEYYDSVCNECDDIDSIIDKIKGVLESICKYQGIEIQSAKYSEIMFEPNDIDELFNELSNSCKDIANDFMEEEDPYTSFYENFGGDSIVYAFKDFHMLEKRIEQINNQIRNKYNGGISTEIFFIGNTTYLTISEDEFWSVLNREFLLMVICALIEAGGNYDN